MSYDGSLKFDTNVDHAGFVSGMSSIKSIALQTISAIGVAFSAGAIVKGMLSIGEQSIDLASDLNEVQNVIDVTFGDSAKKANEFAASSKNSFGISELAAKQYVGAMGAMLKSMQLPTDKALEMSSAITGLAGDMASFYNLSTDEAFDKIRAGIAGEIEPLRQLGINMNIANLEAFALSTGVDKTYASMSQAEQTVLRYNYLLSVTSDAQGDFARTSDSYANSQRLAKLATDELLTAIGNRLLPIASKLQAAYAGIVKESTAAFSERGVKGVIDVITDEFPVATAAVTGLATAFVSLFVIQTLQKVVGGFIATENLLTLATQFGTLAQWNELGALSAKHVVVGLLTGKLSVATAAQWLWNAAISANPVMILVAGVGLLVGSLVLLNKQYEKLHPNAERAIDSVDALKQEVDSSSDAFKSSTEEIESQRRGMMSLVDTLQSMSEEYSGTGIEQRKMQSIVDELNGGIEGLNLTFDKQAGKLSMNADAVRELAQAQYDAAQSTATLSRYTKLLEEQADAEYAVRVARKALYEAGDGSGATVIERIKLNNALRDAIVISEGVTAEIEDCNAQLEQQGVISGEVDESLNILGFRLGEVAKAEERIVIGGVDVTALLTATGESATDAADRLNTFTGAATNMFEKINTKSQDTARSLTSTLDWNTDAMRQYGENMVLLAGQLPQDMLDAFSANPADVAGTVRNLAKASPEDLAALSESWSAAGDTARGAWLKSLGAGTDAEESPLASVAEAVKNDTSLNDAMSQAVTDGKDAMVTAASEADYTEVTTQIQSGIAAGIEPLKKFFFDTGSALVMQWINGMLSRKTEIIGDAVLIAQAVNSAFRNALNLSIPTPSFGVSSSSGSSSKSTGGSAGGASSKGSIPDLAQTFSAGLIVTAANQATSTTNTTSIYAPITVQGVVESDSKLAKRVTSQFQEVVLYGR